MEQDPSLAGGSLRCLRMVYPFVALYRAVVGEGERDHKRRQETVANGHAECAIVEEEATCVFGEPNRPFSSLMIVPFIELCTRTLAVYCCLIGKVLSSLSQAKLTARGTTSG